MKKEIKWVYQSIMDWRHYMRKYLKITVGLLRLLKEYLINFGHLKLHGISYCVCSGVKFWTHEGGICDIGKKTWFSENCLLESSGGRIKFGFNNFMNSNCHIIAIDDITIGDNNLFGPNVVIIDHNHIYDDPNTLICKQGFTSKPVTIGSDIWICGNVIIGAGVTICDHVVIGANSVVTKSILEPGVYAGNPAKKIK